uniref:Ribosomal L1 domain-containing protein 1 n=1 Tax=Mola mola TaxID=94237 RepID=A0A3Q3W7U2_MOLML
MTKDISFDAFKQGEITNWHNNEVFEEVENAGQRCISTRWVCSLKETPRGIVSKVKKAVQALLAFLKTKSTSESRLLDDTQHIIPLQGHFCLFTKDEPNMTPEQTQRFYKRLLEDRGVKNVTEIIPYKVLKTEYKPYEAKRRLLGNFDMFLSDDRIRRLLPSHIGKHFYLRKREPLCVNLQSKNLAGDIQRLIQGTNLKVNNKGSCCMARVGHSGMMADELTDNIEAAVKTAVAKIRVVSKGPVMKVIHVKSQASVALPIYTCNMSHLDMLEKAEKQTETPKKVEEEDEEIPQLDPIATPSKKPKLEVSAVHDC